MTPEAENAIRAQAKRCTADLKAAMRVKPKPKWNDVAPGIIKSHYEKVKSLGISLLKFVSVTGRLNGRYGVES